MAVPIKAGQWGRSGRYGWTLMPFETTRSSRMLVARVEKDGMQFEQIWSTLGEWANERDADCDIIEVSDTDPQLVAEVEVKPVIQQPKESDGVELGSLSLTYRLNGKSSLAIIGDGSLIVRRGDGSVCIEASAVPKLLNAIESLQERRLRVLREIQSES